MASTGISCSFSSFFKKRIIQKKPLFEEDKVGGAREG